MVLKGKHIILGITGGIAAYKSAFLTRLLIKEGAEVQIIMTPHGREFITPVTLSTLTGKPVITEFFSANTGEWHSHVDLGIWADMLIIAPATACTIGKMSNGIADNMLVTTYLSSKCPTLIAPAMDLDMWKHPSTQRNLGILKDYGVLTIEPGSGELASGLTGKGRMAEPEEILSHVKNFFAKNKTLNGKKVLVTAGPTYENIDPVRFIGNYSSGKMGYSLAEKFAERGADVTLVSGPVNLEDPANVKVLRVVSAQQMCDSVLSLSDSMDCMVFAAAVADYAPVECSDIKIKRENKEKLTIDLVRNPDIADLVGKRKKPDQITVGFALETTDELENAKKKLKRKNLDWIVLNSMNDPEAGFNKDTNKVTLISSDGKILKFPAKKKRDVANDIIEEVGKSLFQTEK